MHNSKQISHAEIAEKLSGVYNGEIVFSDKVESLSVLVYVEVLSDVVVSVTFSTGDRKHSFSAILSEEQRDVHMIIQKKITEEYILNGVTGFLCKKPNIHGGYISDLQGFYFHILLNHFNGSYLEIYFFGKESHIQAIAV